MEPTFLLGEDRVKLPNSSLYQSTYQKKEKYRILDRKKFDDQFGNGCLDVKLNHYELYNLKKMRSSGPLKACVVKSGLVLAVKCYDENGLVSYVGLGHFDNISDREFSIGQFLDSAQKKSRSMEVFAFGMYDREQFKPISYRIKKNYQLKELPELILPGKISRNFCEMKLGLGDQEALTFLDELGYSMRVGFINDDLCVAYKQSVESSKIEEAARKCLSNDEYHQRPSIQKQQRKKRKDMVRIIFHDPLSSQGPYLKRESFRVLDTEKFDDKLGDDSFDININQFKFRSLDEIHSLDPTSLIGRNVGDGLVLAVKCYDEKGLLSSVGLGHFTNLQHTEFSIFYFLDAAKAMSDSIEVFAFGLYDEEQFKPIRKKILENYRLKALPALINPWKISNDFCKRLNVQEKDAVAFLEKMGFSLKVGFLKDNLYVADERIVNAVRESMESPDGFLQFSEERFANWIKGRNWRAN